MTEILANDEIWHLIQKTRDLNQIPSDVLATISTMSVEQLQSLVTNFKDIQMNLYRHIAFWMRSLCEECCIKFLLSQGDAFFLNRIIFQGQCEVERHMRCKYINDWGKVMSERGHLYVDCKDKAFMKVLELAIEKVRQNTTV